MSTQYTNPIALNAQHQRVNVGDVVDGEQVVMRVAFNRERWLKQRMITCGCLASSQPLYCLNGLIYCCVAGSCRASEFDSLDVFITGGIPGVSNGAIHAKAKMYGCGCCCQTTSTKTIPLEKIQDVQLIADCCGDTFGFASSKGRPWKVAIETAGNNRGIPELVLEALEDPEGFRAAVMAAKKGLAVPGLGLIPPSQHMAAGAGKGDGEGVALVSPVAIAMGAAGGVGVSSRGFGMPPGTAAGPGFASAEVLNALLRIERSINDGVALLAAAHGKAGSGSSGAGGGAEGGAAYPPIAISAPPAPMHM